MNKIEQIKAEIKRRISSWSIRGKNAPVGQGKDTCESRVTELSDLLSFITSLQQEQPEVDIVMEYDKQFYSDAMYRKLANRNAGIAIASHFYELGLNARKEETK